MTDEAEALRAPTFEEELALVQRALDDPKVFVRVISNSEKLSITYGEGFTRELVRRALLPPAPAPAGAGAHVFYVIERDVETLRNIGGSRSVNAWPHAAAYCMWKFGIPPRGDEWRDTEWTPDINKAIQWTARDDAITFLREHEANDQCLKVAEHAYASMPAPPSGGMTEGARETAQERLNVGDIGSLAYDVETRRFEVAELRKGRIGLSAPDRDAILADVEAILERVLAHLSPASDQDRQADDQNSQEPDGGDHG